MIFRNDITLSDIYVIEDGFLEEVVLDNAERLITLKLLCPLFKGHPDYGKLFNKIQRFFSTGVYLNKDGRHISLNFYACENLVRENVDSNEIDNSPAQVRSWGMEVKDKVKAFDMETDEEIIRFTFSKVDVIESQKVIFSI